MPTYKVTYFDYRAMAEPIRFLLSYGGQEFEDIRIDESKWDLIKNNYPLRQLPVLEIDGKLYHQSPAIVRYLATQFGLTGANEFENYEIDMAYETINDIRTELSDAQYETDERRKAEKHEIVLRDKFPLFSKKLDDLVKTNGGYLANGKLSWVDLYFVAVSEYINYMAKKDIFDGNTNLEALKTKVLGIENIKKWIAKRPYNEI